MFWNVLSAKVIIYTSTAMTFLAVVNLTVRSVVMFEITQISMINEAFFIENA